EKAIEPKPASPMESAPKKTEPTKGRSQSITVPIMGEGIRAAKIVSLLKKPGDRIELDDPLCEVETDKAVYPIESSFAGTMGEWKTKVGDTVDIGQKLGAILRGEHTAKGAVEAGPSRTSVVPGRKEAEPAREEKRRQ